MTLVNNTEDHKKYSTKPMFAFVSQKIFSKKIVAIHEIKSVLTLDKVIYVGFSILDLRTFLMYEFHYKHIKRKFNDHLLFTDTDSLVYDIEEEDVYKDFYEDKGLFGFSNYPKDSKFLILLMKKMLGK